MSQKEDKFYAVLQDVFVGAKVEGQGGFINLMKIKSSYYESIKGHLQQDVEEALTEHPSFRDELFDKLYSFFSRYFTQNGSIYFNETPFHNNVYEKVYTNEKDVVLFWKTQMLYYVKTDSLYRSMPVEFDGLKFHFDASKLENKKANEKKELIFSLVNGNEDEAICLEVLLAKNGTKTKPDDILKALKRRNISITQDQLERAFRVFRRQSEVDYFINKNAAAFLKEQFKLWSYQYFWEGAPEWDAARVNQLQVLKKIAFSIIDFIAQFEDELVKVWNKPKFVKKSNYVITLDRLSSGLVEKIKKAAGYEEQVQEWAALGIAKDNSKAPIDTKHFKDLELEILAQFDNLDQALDGWLIKSENYQALNTILPKFRDKVQCIYIDPPFNLDKSADFAYQVNYKNSNWATLLDNRLQIAREWLGNEGSIFVRCDINGNWILRPVMDGIFPNLKNEIAVKRTSTLKGESGRFHTAWEIVYFYGKSEFATFNGYRNLKDEKEWKWVDMHLPGSRKDESLLYRDFFGKRIKAPEGRRWTLGQEALDDAISRGLVKMDEKTGMPKFLTKWETLGSNWTDISGYSANWNFTTENSEALLQRVMESCSAKSDLVLDFFLGSGTSIAVAQKLNRKWIGIELGEHFYNVILPRMKMVLAYDKTGISKEAKEYQGGGFFKYYELEQYEEALDKCRYADGDLFTHTNKSDYEQYVFLPDEKMLRAIELDYDNDKVLVDLAKLYDDIDIAETLSNLTGKWIKAIRKDKVEFADGSQINTADLDYKALKPLIWWE